MKPAIVLASHTNGLGVIRALGMKGAPVVVVYYDKRDMGHVSKYVKERVPAPHPEKCEEEFLGLLVDLAKRHGGGILIPADDATLVAASRNKSALERHFKVACADWDVVRRVIEKKHSCELAERMGIPAPKTLLPRSLEDAEKFSSSVEYPCVVKPSVGHRYFEIFNRKMTRVDNKEQLLEQYRQAKERDLEVMLQELIPGDDSCGVNFNSYRCDGESLLEFTAEKVRLSPPNFGVPRVLVSKHVPEILEPGRKMLNALGYEGFSCMEFKRDERDGQYKLMEVNGRLNLSVLHSVSCGINFPWIVYRHLLHGERPSASDFKTGVYWIDSTKDIISSVRYWRREKYSLSQYLRPYVKPHVFAIFDFRDPKPFLKRCLYFLQAGAGAVLSRIKKRPGAVRGENTGDAAARK